MISVIVATYGDYDLWNPLAERALRSVDPEAMETIRVHGDDLASARNAGARAASGDRLVFLDADDELYPGFSDLVVESEDVLQPMTMFREPATGAINSYGWIEPAEDLLIRNHIIVGAPVNRELFLESGGFEDYSIAEDWALWLKLRSMGATFGRTSATYVINFNPSGRNAQPDNGEIERIRQAFS